MFRLFLLIITIFTPFTRCERCFRNQTNIKCLATIDKNPLLQFRFGDVKSVDTITVHNSKIDLTDELFSFDNELSGVSLLDVRHDRIAHIGRRGFEHTRNIEYLLLSDNQIDTVQPDPFYSLRKLRVLELNGALSDSADSSTLLTDIFHSRNEFADLAHILLNDNSIKTFKNDTFCKVSGLRRLDLAGNLLKNVEFASCNMNIEALDISRNKITTISAALWDMLPNLSSLDISANPLNCDCALQPFLQIAIDQKVNFLNQEKTVCASPSNFVNKNVFDLPPDFCRSSTHTFLHFVILAIISATVLFAYKKYRNRIDTSAYSHIECEVEPQFV